MSEPVNGGAGSRGSALMVALEHAPHAHDFYAVLRRLEAEHQQLPRLGKAQRPRDEPVRLGADAALDFAPSALSSMRFGAGASPRLGQRFFGLFGPMGPLPLHLTEYVRERERHHGDAALARFADMFHHRALLLLYRAWAQAQPASHLDRRDDDAFSRWTASLYGLGGAEFENAGHVTADGRRHRAALLARGVRSAEGLTKLLRGWFGVPVRLESYVAHWLPTRAEDRTRLTPSSEPQPRNRLGVNAVAGTRVWDRQHRFRLHLGPMNLARYRQFLPGGSALAELREWVAQYVGPGLAYDVVIGLRGQRVPRLRLGRRGALTGQLGWTTWLGASRLRADRADLRLGSAALSPWKGTHHG